MNGPDTFNQALEAVANDYLFTLELEARQKPDIKGMSVIIVRRDCVTGMTEVLAYGRVLDASWSMRFHVWMAQVIFEGTHEIRTVPACNLERYIEPRSVLRRVLRTVKGASQ